MSRIKDYYDAELTQMTLDRALRSALADENAGTATPEQPPANHAMSKKAGTE